MFVFYFLTLWPFESTHRTSRYFNFLTFFLFEEKNSMKNHVFLDLIYVSVVLTIM